MKSNETIPIKTKDGKIKLKRVDARVRMTKRLIRDALFEALKYKGSLKNITISEVCDLAELNRTTFYNYYKNCSDVVTELTDQEIRGMRDIFANSTELFSENNAKELEELFSRFNDLNGAYAEGLVDGGIKEKIMDVIRDKCRDFRKEHKKNGKEQETDMLVSAVAAMFYQLVVAERGKHPIEDAFKIMSSIAEPALLGK